MQAGDHHLQFRQNFIVKIQPVFQNVHLAAGQQPEGTALRREFFIQFLISLICSRSRFASRPFA